jgi:very-short-patch-repair endonuclease
MPKPAKLIEYARQMRKAPTRAEELLWKRLRGRREDGLKFRRQEPIGPFIVDLVCHEARLVIEVDGRDHLWKTTDRERTEWLRREGYEVIRFKNEDALFQPRMCWLAVLTAAYRRVPRRVDKVGDLPTF